jgi:DNA-directed RNA polymerase subunit H (RpoH/RPB5)
MDDINETELSEHLPESVYCLLKARGYIHISGSIPFCKTGLRMGTARQDDIKSPIRIHCIFESNPTSTDRIGMSDFLEIKKNKTKEDHVILICCHVSNQLHQALRQEEISHEILTTFEVNPMIPMHYLVPNYRHIRSPLEIQQIENRFGSRLLFPKLVAGQDPIVKYFGFAPGSLLEVTPKKQNPSIEYRYVISTSDD